MFHVNGVEGGKMELRGGKGTLYGGRYCAKRDVEKEKGQSPIWAVRISLGMEGDISAQTKMPDRGKGGEELERKRANSEIDSHGKESSGRRKNSITRKGFREIDGRKKEGRDSSTWQFGTRGG